MEKHVIDCESALANWTQRRQGDFDSFTMPPQNIAAVLYRQDGLFRVLSFLEEHYHANLREARILDVGSASGYGLMPFLMAGFSSTQLHGIDLFRERVELGRSRYPGVSLHVGDATKMPMFSDASFDLVMEQFCFCHIQSDSTIAEISAQMQRVVKPGGFIIIQDWIYGSKKRSYNGMSLKKIKEMFRVGDQTEIVARYPSQLFPPVGRFLSTHVPSLYPIVRRLLPFLVMSKFTVLKRK